MIIDLALTIQQALLAILASFVDFRSTSFKTLSILFTAIILAAAGSAINAFSTSKKNEKLLHKVNNKIDGSEVTVDYFIRKKGEVPSQLDKSYLESVFEKPSKPLESASKILPPPSSNFDSRPYDVVDFEIEKGNKKAIIRSNTVEHKTEELNFHVEDPDIPYDYETEERYRFTNFSGNLGYFIDAEDFIGSSVELTLDKIDQLFLNTDDHEQIDSDTHSIKTPIHVRLKVRDTVFYIGEINSYIEWMNEMQLNHAFVVNKNIEPKDIIEGGDGIKNKSYLNFIVVTTMVVSYIIAVYFIWKAWFHRDTTQNNANKTLNMDFANSRETS